MNTFHLPSDAKAIIAEIADSPTKRDRALLVVEHSGASDEVRAAFVDALTPKGDSQMKITLKDALLAEGMDTYIDSIKTEATAAVKTELEKAQADLQTSADQVAALQEENKQIEGLQTQLSDTQTAQKTTLAQSIVALALALRKPEINLEAVADSMKTYSESLSDKSSEELQTLHDELVTEMQTTFAKSPSEAADSSVATGDADGADDDPEAEDTEEKVVITDMTSVLNLLNKSGRTKKDK